MDEQEKLFYKIEDYLEGKLPEAEARAFEQALTADPELATAVAKQRIEHLAMERLLEKDLRQKMSRWRAEDLAEPTDKISPSAQRSIRLWLLLLGGMVVLVLGGLAYYAHKKGRPIDKSAAEPATPTPEINPGDTAIALPPTAGAPAPVGTPRTKDTPAQRPAPLDNAEAILAFHEAPAHLLGQLRGAPTAGADLAVALRKYEAGRYAEVIQMLSATPYGDDGRELLAHAYFKNREYAQAAARFREMAGEGYAAPVQDRMEWNLLLSLLMQYPSGNEETAGLFRKMIAPEHYHDYQQKAKQLQEALK